MMKFAPIFLISNLKSRIQTLLHELFIFFYRDAEKLNLLVGLKPKSKYFFLLMFMVIGSTPLWSQYTDVINSNRPGASVSAYAVGRNVIQVETGLTYQNLRQDDPSIESSEFGIDIALRYGLLFEPLEIIYEGSYISSKIEYNAIQSSIKFTDFKKNRIGLKYLIYDRYKNPERNKPNLLSWNANNLFQWKNLIPSVSVYAGANYTFEDNQFRNSNPNNPNLPPRLYYNYPAFTQRAGVNTQSKLTPRSVLITNIAYDQIGSDFPEWHYIVSYTRAFRNPKWSSFIEYQGISSDRYKDNIIRVGTAYLFSEQLQFDAHVSSNIASGSLVYEAAIGASYRLDKHKDKAVAIEDQGSKNGGGGPIKKNAMKKKGKKNKKKSKKDSKKDNGAIDF